MEGDDKADSLHKMDVENQSGLNASDVDTETDEKTPPDPNIVDWDGKFLNSL